MRARRERLGISQGRLGRQLGLTFSQIQKYEKGSNRIGAGRLYHIAAYLDVTIPYFFEGLAEETAEERLVHGDVETDLLAAFRAIAEQETRASVLALVRSLALPRIGTPLVE